MISSLLRRNIDSQPRQILMNRIYSDPITKLPIKFLCYIMLKCGLAESITAELELDFQYPMPKTETCISENRPRRHTQIDVAAIAGTFTSMEA